MIDLLLRSLRHAVRCLVRTPGFTATAVLTLALGMGANSAVFSALDAVLLQPLPYPNPDRLVRLGQSTALADDTFVAAVRVMDWQRLTRSFDAITGYVAEDVSDVTGQLPERLRRARVLPGFLTVWGIAPVIGRGFTDDEHRVGGPPAVIISERYWHGRFGTAGDVLSKTVTFGNRSYRVVGVMPATFAFPERDVDWWSPEALGAPWSANRTFGYITAIGRLRAGVTVEQARADLEAAQKQLSQTFPEAERGIRPVIVPLKQDLVGGSRRSLWLLFGAVTVLLLIACSNIGALLLSRGVQRAPEIAVRYALGASRTSVSLQLLVEAGILALLGGLGGLVVAAGATAGLQRLAADLPRLHEAGLDLRVAAYTVVSVVLVTLLCGVIPAWRASRGHHTLARMEGGRVSPRHSAQWFLAGIQVALSVALLSGAGLLLRSAAELMRVERGFDAEHVLTFRISARFGEEQDYGRIVQRINRTLDELGALPGVSAVATSVVPTGIPISLPSEVEIVEVRARGGMKVESRTVSPGYFDTLRIPIVDGALCGRPAGAEGTTEVMVNRSFVDRYLAGRSPIGLHLAAQTPDRIVGVVGNVRERGIDADPPPTVYSCFSAPTPFPVFLVRTSGDPQAVTRAIRQRIYELEPLRSVYDVLLLHDLIGDAYAENRLRTVVLTVFAISALLLACLGIYGTLSYVVSRRRREVGLRLALGAGRIGILRRFVWEGLRVAAIAAAVGLVLSLAATRALSGLLFGVTPSDPGTLAAVLGAVLLVAALASLVPAARAAMVEPMRILREE
jgi:putative ABC transport system permease protein